MDRFLIPPAARFFRRRGLEFTRVVGARGLVNDLENIFVGQNRRRRRLRVAAPVRR
jgi:hypothetical protein